jgi:Trk K+ transport system NAD-binding subunit
MGPEVVLRRRGDPPDRQDADMSSAAPFVVDPARAEDHRERTGHVVVAGLRGIGLRTIEQLARSGREVVVVDDDPDRRLVRTLADLGVSLVAGDPRSPAVLSSCGIAGARALVCLQVDELRTMETALVARDLRPDLRVVVAMTNPEVGRALSAVTGVGTVLDPAALAAPSLVEACVSRTRHTFDIEGERFVLARVPVPAPPADPATTGREPTLDGAPMTLRRLFGDLAPVAIARDATGEVLICPGRDEIVHLADRVSVVGPAEEVAAITAPPPADEAELPLLRGARFRGGPDGSGDDVDGRRVRHPWRRFARTLVEGLRELDRPLKLALAALAAAVVVSTATLRFGYREPGTHLSWLQALYFTVVTDATVGYGDYSFRGQPWWLMTFGIVDILAGAALATAVFALVTNLLVSRRLAQALGRQRVGALSGHIVVFGLGGIGMRVVEGLLAADREVVVVERDEDNRYLARVRALGVPVILADSTQRETGVLVNLREAAAVAVLTSNDLTNIETGLVIRDSLAERWARVPVVLRVFDRPLAQTVERHFAFRHVRSTSALAAPWFVGAALGLEILDTFYVERQPFLLARLPVAADGGLVGMAMQDLGARLRVLALRRAGRLEHPPRRDTRFAAGDQAYLIGPYEELLQVLDRDQGSA